MSDDQANALKIAVIEEQIYGLREQQRAHNESTQKRFDIFEGKMDGLITAMNRGKGAYAASMVFAGIIGAVVLSVLSWALGFLHMGPK